MRCATDLSVGNHTKKQGPTATTGLQYVSTAASRRRAMALGGAAMGWTEHYGGRKEGRGRAGWGGAFQQKCVVLLLEESSKSGVIGHAYYHYSKAYDSQWHTSATLCLILTKNSVGTYLGKLNLICPIFVVSCPFSLKLFQIRTLACVELIYQIGYS